MCASYILWIATDQIASQFTMIWWFRQLVWWTLLWMANFIFHYSGSTKIVQSYDQWLFWFNDDLRQFSFIIHPFSGCLIINLRLSEQWEHSMIMPCGCRIVSFLEICDSMNLNAMCLLNCDLSWNMQFLEFERYVFVEWDSHYIW